MTQSAHADALGSEQGGGPPSLCVAHAGSAHACSASNRFRDVVDRAWARHAGTHVDALALVHPYTQPTRSRHPSWPPLARSFDVDARSPDDDRSLPLDAAMSIVDIADARSFSFIVDGSPQAAMPTKSESQSPRMGGFITSADLSV